MPPPLLLETWKERFQLIVNLEGLEIVAISSIKKQEL